MYCWTVSISGVCQSLDKKRCVVRQIMCVCLFMQMVCLYYTMGVALDKLCAYRHNGCGIDSHERCVHSTRALDLTEVPSNYICPSESEAFSWMSEILSGQTVYFQALFHIISNTRGGGHSCY